MRKRMMFLVTLLMLLTMVLAACGGADDTADDGADAGTDTTEDVVDEAAEETDDATDEGVEQTDEAHDEAAEETDEAVDEAAEETDEATDEEGAAEEQELGERPEGGILIWADDTRAPVLQELVGQFEEEFGIPVAVEQPADTRGDFVIAAPAGEGPDLIVGAHDWLGQLVDNGLLAPVDLGPSADQFVEAAVEAFTYNGELYGMPVATENVAFFRNTDLVPEAPETWEEVMEICAELEGQVDQCYAQREGDPYHFYPMQTAFGGTVFGQDAEGNFDPNDVQIDSEGSIAAAQFLDEMREAGYYQTGGDYETVHTIFEQGDAAFLITGPWAMERINDAGVPYAISAIPSATQEGAPFLGVQGFMVNAFGEGQIEAQLFLTEFIATEEVMQQLADATSRPSAFQPVLDAQMDDEVLAGFAEAGEAAIPMPAIPEMASVWDAWTNAIILIVQGSEDPATAFENAGEQIRTLIEGQ